MTGERTTVSIMSRPRTTDPASGAPVRRNLDGILLLDKPVGLSSNRVLQRVKRLYRANKAGHTGSLDPLASGMLPLVFGRGTRLSAFLLKAPKRYQVTGRLGIQTATGDSEGEILKRATVGVLASGRLESALSRFRGEILQVPPMYSALKQSGQRLYKLARQGKEVPREPRRIHIHELQLVGWDAETIRLEVLCSKGTYVRSLIEDLSIALGTVGHVIELRRLSVGPFAGEPMHTVAHLEEVAEIDQDKLDDCLLPIEAAVPHLVKLEIDAATKGALLQGQTVAWATQTAPGLAGLYDRAGVFFGLGEVLGDDRLKPSKMFPPG